MIPTIRDFYSYIFQEEDQVTAVYFSTHTGTEYRVYFYPASEYFDGISEETLLYKQGYFFGFTKLAPNEDKKEHIDTRVRNTILQAISDFFDEKGIDKVLIFYCDDGDGKKAKRAKCFDEWYQAAEIKNCFKKIDEEIVIPLDTGNVDIDYMSLIIECKNPQEESITKEFQQLKERLIGNK